MKFNSLLAVAMVLAAGTITQAQTLVAHWAAEDVADGTVFTLGGPGWEDRIDNWEAVAEPGPDPFNSPRVDPTLTIGHNNRRAVAFNQPDTSGGGLVVNRGFDPLQLIDLNNPVAGLTAWSATVVFQTSDPATGGGGTTDPGGWWDRASLIGIELGGGDRGDWAIWMSDGNATNGARVGASRGDPDAGTVYDQPINDGQARAVTATYFYNDVTWDHEVNLYIDGVLVNSSQTFSGGLNDAAENYELRIGHHNNFGFYKGLIGEIQLHEGVLSPQDVQSLHASLDNYYGFSAVSPGGNADFNGDGIVDGHDFLTWQRGYGLIGQSNNSNGDANGDGTVNGADLGVWEQQFGGTGSSFAAVPEPTAACLAIMAFAGLGLRAFRYRRA